MTSQDLPSTRSLPAGRLVWSRKGIALDAGLGMIELPLADLHPGIYIVVLRGEEGGYDTCKVVVLH